MKGTEFARISGSYSTAFIGTYESTGQDSGNNTTTFLLRAYFYYGGGTQVNSQKKGGFYIDGTWVHDGNYSLGPGYYEWGSKYITVTHNKDGSWPGRSVGISGLSYHINGETSGDLWAPKIARAPSYTSTNASNITEHSVRLTGSVDTKTLSITEGGWDLSTDGGTTIQYYANDVTDKTITGLEPGTKYWYRGYVKTAGGGANSSWQTFTTKDCVVRKNINSTWKTCVPYKKINGTWKKTIPYIKVNGTWKEGIN